LKIAKIILDDKEYRFDLKPKRFRTGSVGFHGFGKIYEDGRAVYQVNVIVVKIGSKHQKEAGS